MFYFVYNFLFLNVYRIKLDSESVSFSDCSYKYLAKLLYIDICHEQIPRCIIGTCIELVRVQQPGFSL